MQRAGSEACSLRCHVLLLLPSILQVSIEQYLSALRQLQSSSSREPGGNKVSLEAATRTFCPHDPFPPSRRSIQNNTYGTYQCRRAKACSITLKTRRNCQWCRYQRCLAVGMKPSWVLSSDERERRFRKNRDKKEKKEASAAQSAGVSPPPQSPGHAVVLPSLPHHLVTVKTDLFPVSTVASSSPTAPQFATIQMIPSGGLRLENPRPQLLPHTGVIVRQYSRFPPPLQSLPPVDLRVKLEAPSHLGEVAHPVLGLEQQQLGQVQKMEGSPLPSPPPLTPFVSEACSFNQRWLLSHSRVPKPSFKLTFAPAQLLALE